MPDEDSKINAWDEPKKISGSIKKTDFKGHLSKKWLTLIAVCLAVIVVFVIAVLAWYFIIPFATVDGKKISRSEYQDMNSKMNKFYEYNGTNNNQKEASKLANDRLIEEKIIESEAKKRGITVSDSEVNARYQSIVKNYKSEDEYIKTIKGVYDWTPELTKRTIKTDMLTEKLKEVVLKGYDVSFIMVRYDLIAPTEDPAALPRIQSIYNKLKSGAKWDAVYAENKNKEPTYVVGKYDKINEVSQTIFASDENWKAISKLKNVGDITGVTKTKTGYYVIYRADKMSGGEFNTWDDFIKYYKDKYVSYGFANKAAILLKSFLWQKTHAIGLCDPAFCPRGGNDSTPYHPALYAGDVRDDNTGALLPNVDVRLYTPVAHYYLRQCNGEQIDVAYDRTKQTSGVSVWDQLNWPNPSYVVNFHFGARRSGCGQQVIESGPDCHLTSPDTAWRSTFSKAGYFTVSLTKIGQTMGNGIINGEIVRDHIRMTPKVWGLDGNITVSPSQMYVGETATFTSNIWNSGNVNSPQFDSSVWWSTNSGQVSWIQNPGDGGSTLPRDASHSAKAPGESIIPRINTFTANQVGQYCQSLSFGPQSSVNSGWVARGPACVNVIERPVFWQLIGDSKVSINGGPRVQNANAYRNDVATYYHNVTNIGPNNMNTGFSTNVVWALGTGNISSWASGGSGATLPSSLGYAALAVNASINPQRINNFNIPSGTLNNTRFCQRIDYTEASQAHNGGNSNPPACVTVYVPTPATYTPDIDKTEYEKGSRSPDTVNFNFFVRLPNSGPCDGARANGVTVDTITWQAINLDTNTVLTTRTVNVPNCTATTNSTLDTYTIQVSGLDSTLGQKRYQTRITSVVGTSTTINNPMPKTADGWITVFEVPYTRFYGHDIYATSATSGGIYFNTKNTVENSSSAVEYAAIAAGSTNPQILTAFARSATAIPNAFNSLGARWNGGPPSPASVPAQYLFATSTAYTGGALPGTTGYYTSSGATISGGSISNTSNKVTINNTGDLYITGNISAEPLPASINTGAAFDGAAIPVVLLITNGNIYIRNNVTEIDAILISTNGTVFTCATGTTPTEVARNQWSRSSALGGCANKLLIKGALGAREIRFARSVGTRLMAAAGESYSQTQGNTTAAESIYFPPYLYFASPYLNNPGNSTYQSLFNTAPLF